jgi:phage/plasmid-associated DNA primase
MQNDYHEIDPFALIWSKDEDIAKMLKEQEFAIDDIAQYYVQKYEIERDDSSFANNFFESLPTNEGAFAGCLNEGYKRIIKSTGRGGQTFKVYDYTAGVWVTEGEELLTGEKTQEVIDYVLRGFEKAAVRTATLVASIINIVYPPMPRPSSKDDTALNFYLAREAVLKEIKRKVVAFSDKADNIRGKYISSVLRQWRTLAFTDEEAWDADMRWVVCQDATVDLQLIKNDFSKRIFECTVPHAPEQMSTNSVSASTEFLNIDYIYSDNDDLPAESKFILGVARTLPDADIREFMQARFGVALYGTPGEFGKAMVWQFGESDTAKSSIQEVIAGQHGVFSEYSWTGNSTVLCTGNGAASDTEANRFKAKSRGKRFVLINELDDGAKLSQSKVKSLTGGDTVYGDTKYGSEVNYSFTATIFMASNHGPRLPEGDTALSSRILVVPFDHHYWIQEKNPKKWLEEPENRANPHWVDDVLSSEFERSMILLWVLEGARKYFYKNIGKEIPEAIQKAGDKFKNAADIVSQTVMTMLGENDDADGVRQTYIIYNDDVWHGYGNLDSDGVLVTDFVEAFKITLAELGLEDDYVSKHMRKYVDSAIKYVDEKYDARLKTVRLPGGMRRKIFTRMKQYTNSTTIKQAIEDERAFNGFMGSISE